VSNIVIGSKVWIFDINCRQYRKDSNGRNIGSPIWFYHWRESEIVDETSRSWVLKNGKKVPKKNWPDTVSFSIEDIKKEAWVKDNVRHISESVRYLSPELLRQVAALIGHKDRI
jgi:hypothetical protein